jgi:DNA primase
VRFRVERVLAAGDDSTPEGRDRMIEELRPVFAQLPPSAMRMELTRMAAGRLAVPESFFEQQLTSPSPSRPASRPPRGDGQARDAAPPPGARPGNGSRREGKILSGRADTERAFLALCIASPEEGERALASLDVDQHFSSELLRRAARHLLAGDLREPMSASTDGDSLEADPDLKALLTELVVAAGRDAAHPAMLEAQRLQLELARVERQIQQARGEQSGEVSQLAQRKATVKLEFDRAYGRVLEETGDREG